MDSTLVTIVVSTITLTGLCAILILKEVKELFVARDTVTHKSFKVSHTEMEARKPHHANSSHQVFSDRAKHVCMNRKTFNSPTSKSNAVPISRKGHRLAFADQVNVIPQTLSGYVIRDNKPEWTPPQLGGMLGKMIKPGTHSKVTDSVLRYISRLCDLHKLKKIDCKPFMVGKFETRYGTSDVKHPDRRPEQTTGVDNITLIHSTQSVPGAKPNHHMFLIFVDNTNKQVVVLDTQFKQDDNRLVALTDKAWPMLGPFNKLRYNLVNLTGQVFSRKGASTIAWSAWLATALLLDYNGCMPAGGQIQLDTLQRCKTQDVLAFWKLVAKK